MAADICGWVARVSLMGLLVAGGMVRLAAAGGQDPVQVDQESVWLVDVNLSVSGVLRMPAGPAAFSGDDEPQQEDRRGAVSGLTVAVTEQPIRAKSHLIFHQRPAGLAASGESVLPGAVRQYQQAEARLTVGDTETTVSLAPDAEFVHVGGDTGSLQAWLAEGFLTQAEHDLLVVPFDPLLAAALEPPADATSGDTWAIDQEAAAGLLCIDAVTAGRLEATIGEATDNASVSGVLLTGTITGAVAGVPTAIEVNGTYDWSRGTGLTALAVDLRETRQPGHVAPGFRVEARLTVNCRPATEAEPAKRLAKVSVVSTGPSGRSRRGPGRPGGRWLVDPHGRYDLIYPDAWHLIEQGGERATLRLIDRGALVGEVVIRPLPLTDTPLTLEALQGDIERSLAGQFSHLVAAAESQRSDGTTILRVASAGEDAGLPFEWIHYHVSAADGPRVSLSFMVESRHRQRFAEADMRLVEGLFLPPQ